jgi:probable phosphoglycerate mutase
MELCVVRHGESVLNAQGRYGGSVDTPLTCRGKEQARQLAASLVGMRFDAAVSSTLTRARQTADIVCGALGMPYTCMPDFAERCLGVYEGLTRTECKARHPDMWARLASRDADGAPDGGETIRAFDARVAGGLALLKQRYPGQSVLLIAHGFVATTINRQLVGLSFDDMFRFKLNNCDLARYTIA